MNASTKQQDPQRKSDFLLSSKFSASRELGAIAGFLVLLVLSRAHALLSLGSQFLGGSEGDAGLYIWLMQSNCRDLFSLSWFNTSAFYPYTKTLAWSDNFILPSFAAWPFLKIGIPLVLVYNAILLTAHFLNGYCTFRLCYQLTGKTFASFVAGALFMSYSGLTSNLGHPQLQFIFWIPLALSALYSYFARPRFSAGLVAGLCVTGAFLCTVYYSIFCLIALLGAVFVTAILRPAEFSRKQWGKLAFAAAVGALPLVFFVGPYLAVRATFGERAIYEAYYFAASAVSYLSAAPFNFLYGHSSSWSHPEANLFPGFAVLVLVAAAFPRLWNAKPLVNIGRTWALSLVLLFVLTSDIASLPYTRVLAALVLWANVLLLLLLIYRMGFLERKLGFHIMTNRGLTASFLFLALLFFAISLGPLGNPEKHQFAWGVYRFFYELFPGFNSIRAIGRAGLVSVLFMCVLCAFSLASIAEKKRRVATPLMSMVLALGIAENYVPLYPIDNQIHPPPAIDYLRTQVQDKNSALIVLPMAGELTHEGLVKSWSDFARRNTLYMNWAFGTGLHTVNGYSGQRSKLMKELPSQLLDFPDQRSVNALRSIAGLRYVLYASARDPGFSKVEFEARVKNLPGNLSLLMSDGEGNYVFELSGSSRIRTDTYLLVPSYPPGTVYLELMGLYRKDAPDVEVEIYAMNHSQTTPISTATVKQNGEWERFMISLPRVADSVRPNWLTFRLKADATILFRESSYTLDGD